MYNVIIIYINIQYIHVHVQIHVYTHYSTYKYMYMYITTTCRIHMLNYMYKVRERSIVHTKDIQCTCKLKDLSSIHVYPPSLPSSIKHTLVFQSHPVQL